MTINGEQIETYSDMSKTSVFGGKKRTISFPGNLFLSLSFSKKDRILRHFKPVLFFKCPYFLDCR